MTDEQFKEIVETLYWISRNIGDLEPTLWDYIVDISNILIAITAFFFSYWVYKRTVLKEMLNAFEKEQSKISQSYLFDQLDLIYNNGVIDFNKANLALSNRYILLLNDLFLLFNRCRRSEVNRLLLKKVLSNNMIWIVNIYCLQSRGYNYPLYNKLRFLYLWKKLELAENATLFYNEFGLDELSEIPNEEIARRVDERRFLHNERYEKILNEMLSKLS